MSQAVATPPEATTRWRVRPSSSKSPSRSGPDPVPSRSMSVTTTPASSRSSSRSRAALSSRPEPSTQPARPGPAGLAVAGAPAAVVETDKDPPGPATYEPGQNHGAFHGHGTDHDTCHACVQQRRGGGVVTHAATGLDRHLGKLGNAKHDLAIGRASVSCRVEVDDCRRSAPAATSASATSSGSPYAVSAENRPWESRTHLPARCRSQATDPSSARIHRCRLGTYPGEAPEQPKSGRGRLLRVELGPEQVAPLEGDGDLASVLTGPNDS